MYATNPDERSVLCSLLCVAAFAQGQYDEAMSFSETLILVLLAYLLFGPKKLPEIARQVGKALNEFKRASNEFKAQVTAEISQLEMETQQQVLPPVEPPAGVVRADSGRDVPGNGSTGPDESPETHSLVKAPNA